MLALCSSHKFAAENITLKLSAVSIFEFSVLPIDEDSLCITIEYGA